RATWTCGRVSFLRWAGGTIISAKPRPIDEIRPDRSLLAPPGVVLERPLQRPRHYRHRRANDRVQERRPWACRARPCALLRRRLLIGLCSLVFGCCALLQNLRGRLAFLTLVIDASDRACLHHRLELRVGYRPHARIWRPDQRLLHDGGLPFVVYR